MGNTATTDKILALANHLGIDVITYNDVNYANVTLADYNEENKSQYNDIDDIGYNEGQQGFEKFEKWLIDTANLLEDELIQSTYNENLFEYGNSEYLVCTDSEADELWDEDLENYIEECILPELDERYRRYFDNEAFKSDARMDGRGHSLNRYDGNEYEVDGFYIYQTN